MSQPTFVEIFSALACFGSFWQLASRARGSLGGAHEAGETIDVGKPSGPQACHWAPLTGVGKGLVDFVGWRRLVMPMFVE